MSVETYRIDAGWMSLPATLSMSSNARGVVVISHGGASTCQSPGNRCVADALTSEGLATVLPNLLLPTETADQEVCFDVDLLADRLKFVVEWVMDLPLTRGLPIGLFGASTAAASALRVAADMPDTIRAVVARRGRPELVGAARLARIRCPTLLMVTDGDRDVMGANEVARSLLKNCEARLVVLPRTGYLMVPGGSQEQMAELTRLWFGRHLPTASPRATGASGVN